MRGTILIGAFMASCLIMSEATIIIPGALAGLAVLKLAALKGLVVGSLLARGGGGGRRRGYGGRYRGHHGHYRGKRALNNLESLLLSASQQDTSDCAKRLVCEVSALPFEKLDTEEAVIADMFDPDNLDLARTTVEFDLAAQIGKRVGIKQCSIIYERCPHDRQQLISIFRDPKFGNEY